MRQTPTIFTLLLLGLALGCGRDDDALPDDQDEPIPLGQLQGGDYQMFTAAVEDGCLDGALEALFMPAGPSERHAFEYLVYVPSEADLPTSYAVDFREPFLGMDVTVSRLDDTTLDVVGSTMEAVALGGNTGDCVADMQADARLWPVAKDRVNGTATIEIRDPRGSEGLCPVFEEDPCRVTLELEGELD
jgi:hypothetical protein